MTRPWHSLRVVLASIVLISTYACAGPAAQVTEVLNHSICKKLRTGVSRVQFENLAEIRGVQFLINPAQTASAADDAATENPALAAQTADLILIAVSNGSQPTPGYGFKLLNVDQEVHHSATGETQEWQLHYRWMTPSPNAVMAQMITSPCSVVQLSRTQLEAQNVNAVSAWLDGEQLGRVSVKP